MNSQDITRRNFFKIAGLSALFIFKFDKVFNFNNPYTSWFDDDERICKSKFSLFIDSKVKELPIGKAIAEIGKSFIGTDYVAGTLDKSTNENLVINLTGLDCVTFVENCLTFARCVKKGKTSFEDYKSELSYIRYRDGNIDGYGSRLHYFTDWIYNNAEKGIVKDISIDIGGKLNTKKINFMSSHPKSYKQLADKKNLEMVQIAEEAINSRDQYYISVKQISSVYDQLQTGDIIATTTSIEGLDVTHTGYVYKDDSGTYFMHASSKKQQVIISNNELQQYIEEDSKKTGIIVARPLEV